LILSQVGEKKCVRANSGTTTAAAFIAELGCIMMSWPFGEPYPEPA